MSIKEYGKRAGIGLTLVLANNNRRPKRGAFYYSIGVVEKERSELSHFKMRATGGFASVDQSGPIRAAMSVYLAQYTDRHAESRCSPRPFSPQQ